MNAKLFRYGWLLLLTCLVSSGILFAGPEEDSISLVLRLRPGQTYEYDSVFHVEGKTIMRGGDDGDDEEYPSVMEFRHHMIVDVLSIQKDSGKSNLKISYPHIWNEGYDDGGGTRESWRSFYNEGEFLHVTYDDDGEETWREEEAEPELTDMENGVIQSSLSKRNEWTGASTDKGHESKLGPHRTFFPDFLVYPMQDVTVGDSWTSSLPIFEYTGIVGEELTVELHYTLDEIVTVNRKQAARIVVTGEGKWSEKTVERNFPQDIYIQIVDWDTLKHKYDGYYLVDLNTGLLLDSKLTIQLDGTFKQRYIVKADNTSFANPNTLTETYTVVITRKPWDPNTPVTGVESK